MLGISYENLSHLKNPSLVWLIEFIERYSESAKTPSMTLLLNCMRRCTLSFLQSETQSFK